MLKAVRLARKGERFVVEGAAIEATPAGAINGTTLVDPPALADAIRRLCRDRKLAGKRVAAALSGQDIFVARLKVERNQSDSLEGRLRAEAASIAPFPLEGAALDYHVLDNFSHPDWVDALVVAAPPGRVDRLVDLLHRARKSLAVVEATACALVNVFQVNYEPAPTEVTALVHAGASTLSVVIVRGSAPVLARDVLLASSAMSPAVPSAPERVVVELERTFERLDETADDHPLEPRSSQIQRILLSGGAARTRGLEEMLRSRIKLPFEAMNPFRNVDFQNGSGSHRLVWDHLHCMPIAVGLALRAFDAAGPSSLK
jgi:type IV pilus assembly protein PilM